MKTNVAKNERSEIIICLFMSLESFEHFKVRSMKEVLFNKCQTVYFKRNTVPVLLLIIKFHVGTISFRS